MILLNVIVAIATALTIYGNSSAQTAVAGKPLATSEKVSVTAEEHRVFQHLLSNEQYDRPIPNTDKLKSELDEILLLKHFASDQANILTGSADERAFVEMQTLRGRLNAQAQLVEKRAIEQLRASPEKLDARAREIYLTTEPSKSQMEVAFQQIRFDVTTRPIEETAKRITEARRRLDAGESFDDVAKALSDDEQVKSNAGRLSVVAETLDTPFRRLLVDELKPNQIASQLITTRRGIHIVKLISVSQPQKKPFDDVKQAIIDKIVSETAMAARSQFYSTFAPKSVTYNEDELNKRIIVIPPEAWEAARKMREDLERARKEAVAPK